MKTDAERMALIRQRTAQLQRQARARQMLLIDAGCMAACLALVVCLGLAMPGWAGTSVALHVSPTGTAGMLSERGADGYILVGVLSFLLGSCVTILLYRLRRSSEKKSTRGTTMSFEIIDNTFQVIVLAAMALLAFLLAFRRSSRSCLILAFGYASFMMGTLYYLLHLIILGHGPQVFYVAECSWMASYFFFLSLEILYWEGLRPPFSPFALAAGVVIAGVVMRVQVFGPSPLMSGALALTFGALAYLCFSALQKEKRLRPYEIALLFEMLLQILLFVASEFIRDYTRFSFYYAVDILLTLTLVSFLPHILREEPHDLH